MAATEEGRALPAEVVREIEELCTHYPKAHAALIPALHMVQDASGGWISPEAMEALAELLRLEPVEVYGVASFYPMFHLRPRGEHLVSVCHNISCALRGADEIMATALEVTGCKPGRTSPDGRFTVKGVECQGACTNAPMLDLDGVFHENLTPEDVERLLRSVSDGGEA